MKKKLMTFILIILSASLIIGMSGCSTNSQGTSTPGSNNTAGNSNRELAYDFSWRDANGNTVKLSEQKGKVVLIDFWATWCGPCKMTIPIIEKLYEDYMGKDFLIIGINLDQGVEASVISDFVKENGMKYLVVTDPNSSVSSKYGVTSIPRFFFIDKNGRIANMVIGYKDNMYDTFSKQINSLLEE